VTNALAYYSAKVIWGCNKFYSACLHNKLDW